jgi:hypothetical protein
MQKNIIQLLTMNIAKTAAASQTERRGEERWPRKAYI